MTDVSVAVVGAGVVGCAVARKLAGYRLSVAPLEAAGDVGEGTSKANTTILHTGFDRPQDAPPNGHMDRSPLRSTRHFEALVKAVGPVIGFIPWVDRAVDAFREMGMSPAVVVAAERGG